MHIIFPVYYSLLFGIPVLNKNYCSLNKAKVGSQQWRKAQESLLGLEKRNAASVDTIVR